MAISSGTKKVTISSKDLPAPAADNTYAVRYRIVSDDKNLASSWSQINIVNGFPVSTSYGTLNQASDLITAAWVSQKQSSYDVFIKFGLAVTNKKILNNVATLTVSNVLGFSVGDTVTVSSVGTEFNGTFVLTAVDTVAKTISYAKTNSNVNQTGANGIVETDFIYDGTTSNTNYSVMRIFKNSTPSDAKPTRVTVLVQKASQLHLVSQNLEIWTSGTTSLV